MCTKRKQCNIHQESSTTTQSHSTTTQNNETYINKEEILEFVVVGNGPSGICLSFMLSGNRPYYTWKDWPCQDEYLHARLMQNPDASIVEQDLEFLSDGLEGRSSNPVSVLLDTLQRPKADLNLDLASHLTWRKENDKESRHVVLGKGPPGGVWQTLEGNLKTVSLGAWMQLPSSSTELINSHDHQILDEHQPRRLDVTSVAQYYTEYVQINQLSQNFRNNTVVTKVRRVDPTGTVCRVTSKSPHSDDLEDSTLRDNSKAAADDCDNDTGCGSSLNSSIIVEGGDGLPGSYLEAGLMDRRLCVCEGCCCLEPCTQVPQKSDDWRDCCKDNCSREDTEDVFSIDGDDISSVCSSLTHLSYSPPTQPRNSNRDTESCGRCLRSRSSSGHLEATHDTVPLYQTTPALGQHTTRPRNNQDTFMPYWPSSSSAQYIPTVGQVTLEEIVCPSWDPIIFMPSTTTSSSFTPSQSFSRQNSSSSYQPRNSVPKLYSCEKVSAPATLFEVSGYEILDTKEEEGGEPMTKEFKYLTQNVVLATGLNKPNKLEVPGEELNFVFHHLREIDAAVRNKRLTPNSDPILIIGSGLTSADAIISAQAYNIPVIHVFRKSAKDPHSIFNQLPNNIYPEYEKVRNMMGGGSVTSSRHLKGGELRETEHASYTPYAETIVTKITNDREVFLQGPNHTNKVEKVSMVLVLIGSSLQPDILDKEDGEKLGRRTDMPVGKNNPVDIDVFTHQSINIPGLFALGPLVGDNFVRFLQGGALAIASFADKQKKLE